MARERDPTKVIRVIAEVIRVSQRGARKVKAHRFKEFGSPSSTALTVPHTGETVRGETFREHLGLE